MKLKVLLPYQVFEEIDGVLRIVAETPQGSYGLLPQRLDCVAILEAGILTYQTGISDDNYIAVDEGVLVKTGNLVLVSVRNAIAGLNLGRLREAVEREFININDSERQVRAVLARLESGFARRFAEYNRGQL